MINTFPTEGNLSGLSRKDFQKDINDKKTDLFILKNKKGMEVAVTNYGCAILSIMVPDKDGKYANVVLSYGTLDALMHGPEPFLSTTIGRYGNRIAKGKFTLYGEEHSLTINNGPNSLHGGPTGFHARVWDAEQLEEGVIQFNYTSADGEEGFPGNLEVEMTYRLEEEENAIVIEYRATTDKATVVNLTNHGFFNLAGTANPTPTVENNIVTINADFYTPIDEVSIPTGEIAKVEGTPMDFRTPHTVGERINDKFQQLIYGAGYDHCICIEQGRNRFSLTWQLPAKSPTADAPWRYIPQKPAYNYTQATGWAASKEQTELLSPHEALSASKLNASPTHRIKHTSRRLLYCRAMNTSR